MKDIVCNILYFMAMVGLPLTFSVSGLGIDTWQWWTLLTGMFTCHILGVLKMVD